MASKQWLVEDYEAGDLPLTSGETLRYARLRYHRIGELNAPKDNLIMLPTYYGGAAAGNHPWVRGNSPLDPDRYCIVIPALLGAGESSSPSNTAGAQGGPGFPAVSLYDNVMLQKRLVEDVFGDARIALVMGWSMGGMQALQRGCLFPTQVRAVLATCCTARCYPHNLSLLHICRCRRAPPGLARGRRRWCIFARPWPDATGQRNASRPLVSVRLALV